MPQSQFVLAAMAEIGAMRNVLVHSLALRLLEEPAPLQTLSLIGGHLNAMQTQPADSGGTLDPAMSDLLAALTDERTRDLVSDIEERLVAIMG